MNRQRMSGFTLLETLVALVLMSLLMVALFGGFRAGIASWRVADSHIEHAEPQLLLNRMLYRHFSQLALQAEGDFWGEQAQNLSFTGRSDSVRYVAPLALSVGNQLYSIELASGQSGHAGVWVRFAPYNAQIDMHQQLDSIEYLQVSDGLVMQLSYYLNEEWLDVLEEGVVPQLVRVRWQDGQRRWPDSVFRISGADHAG